jgi:hypothetical protein
MAIQKHGGSDFERAETLILMQGVNTASRDEFPLSLRHEIASIASHHSTAHYHFPLFPDVLRLSFVLSLSDGANICRIQFTGCVVGAKRHYEREI